MTFSLFIYNMYLFIGKLKTRLRLLGLIAECGNIVGYKKISTQKPMVFEHINNFMTEKEFVKAVPPTIVANVLNTVTRM